MTGPGRPGPVLRAACPEDGAAIAQIYRPFVEQTTVSFELEAPSADEMRRRIAEAQRRHEWLVAELDGDVVGYAYGVAHRARPAYRYSAEVSVYLADAARGQGIGRALYEALFVRLGARGYCNALAGITLPNDASVAFHERTGFRRVGVYHGVGFKFGAWRDVVWYERRISQGAPAVDTPGV